MVTVGGGCWSTIGFAPIWTFLARFFWVLFGAFLLVLYLSNTFFGLQ